ncbi:MAG: trypsin-like serine protease [Chthonomonadales bacterium]|nr:trypsin-like serine protease [Chthonomonadales bacterium]
MRKGIIIAVGGLIALGLLGTNLRIRLEPQVGLAQGTDGLGVTPAGPARELPTSEVYARAAQSVYKAVVNIDLTQRVRVRSLFFDDEFFGGPRYREAQSHGSGVIITKDGYVLTNQHVVGDTGEAGRTITISLTDGRRMPGTVVGADRTTDVALVKVNGSNLPTAPVGTVRGLVPGQMVVAIGNPLDLRFTVTNGVVSALNRPITVEDRLYSDLIQHDALINPGNSGGPLVNMAGQVIGINTLIRPDAQGIGFAIPIDTALKVADELKRFGKVKRPWLGLVVLSNNRILIERFGLPDVEGAVVRGVYRSGPVVDLGLEQGDVITKLAGKAVKSEDDFKAIERSLRIGEMVDIEWRNGERLLKGRVKVGEAP